MKKIHLLITVLLFSVSTFSQDSDNALCKVKKYNSVYVFFHSEPIAEYKEVFSFTTSVSSCIRQSSQCDALSKSAIIQAYVSKVDFDAIIIGNTKSDIAIKFTGNEEDKSLGKVSKVNGALVFIGCSPENDHVQIKRVKRFRKKNNKCYISYELAEQITKRGAKHEGLIIGEDNYHWWIDFE